MSRAIALVIILGGFTCGQSINLSIIRSLPPAAGRPQPPSVKMAITISHPPGITLSIPSPRFAWNATLGAYRLHIADAPAPGATSTQTTFAAAVYGTGYTTPTGHPYWSTWPVIGNTHRTFVVQALGMTEIVGQVYETYAAIYNAPSWPGWTVDLVYQGTNSLGTSHVLSWTRTGSPYAEPSEFWPHQFWRIIVYSLGTANISDPFTGVTIPVAIDNLLLDSIQNANTATYGANVNPNGELEYGGVVYFMPPPSMAGVLVHSACALVYRTTPVTSPQWIELAGCSDAVFFVL